MDRFRVSRAQEMWLPLGLAGVFVVLPLAELVTGMRRPGLWGQIQPWLVGSMATPFLCYAAFYRLRWSAEEFRTTWGPWKWRGVHLDCLVSLTVGSAASAVWVEAVDGHGCRMRLNQTVGWTDQRLWGPLLVDAAGSCGAQMDERAESFLVKTPSERRWGPPGPEGPGRHEHRPT